MTNKRSITIFKTWFLLLGILLSASGTFAQQELKAYLDSSRMEVGNHATFHMEITTGKNQIVKWPYFPNGIHKDIEVLEYFDIDTVEVDNEWKLTRDFSIIPFDVGSLPILPFIVVVQSPKQSDTLYTESMLLEVYGPKLDSTETFKPIKPIQEEPYTFSEIAPYVLGGYLALSALILLIWFIRKLILKEPILSPVRKPLVPAHTEAIKALDKLGKKKLWESGEYKLYYTELTNVVRRYMDRELEIPALEETSDQIVQHLHASKISPQLFEGIKNMFRTSDFVKFAKMQPNDDDNSIHLKTAYRFVEEIHQSKIVELENNQPS